MRPLREANSTPPAGPAVLFRHVPRGDVAGSASGAGGRGTGAQGRDPGPARGGTGKAEGGPVMKRRTFLGMIAGGLLAAPLGAEAQPARPSPKVGHLSPALGPSPVDEV